MPRVTQRTKSRAGAERKCGVCNTVIEPGQKYLQWSFRYGGIYYRCTQHPPKRSDLTQSKMATVYEAIENAETELPNLDNVEDIKTLLQEVIDVVYEVAQEYEEAAEPFGGQGENQDRADELNSWASELESFDPEEPGEFDEEEAAADAQELMTNSSLGLTLVDAIEQLRSEHEELCREKLEDARAEAQDMLNGYPL